MVDSDLLREGLRMKVYNKRTGIILLILALLALGTVVLLFVNYKSVTRQLRAEHDKGVELIREYWSALFLEKYHETFEEYRRIVGLEYAQAESETPKYRAMALRQSEAFIGGALPDPLATKEADLFDVTILACLEAAIVAHLCRARTNGAWPETLESCGEIPIDPWDDARLRYNPPAKRKPAIIYSVSTNRQDDGGEAEHPLVGSSSDFVFPLGPWPEPEDGDGE